MAEAFDGFEERVDRAITDLEDALLGITDDDIRNVLKAKGYEALGDSQFRDFKDQLKDTLLDRLIANNHQQKDERTDSASESSSTTASADFDISHSSYRKIPSPLEAQKPEESDLEKLLQLITNDSESFAAVTGDAHEDSEVVAEELIHANPEFARSTVCHNAAADCWNNRNYRRRTQSFSFESCKSDSHASSNLRKRKQSFEQFVRRECRTQMDLITGSNRTVWVPTKPKCSPQVRYGQYKKIWEKFPIPGEKPRRELRWAIRNQMARKEEPQRQSWWPEVKSP